MGEKKSLVNLRINSNSGSLCFVNHLPTWPDLQSPCLCLNCSKCNLGQGSKGDLRMTVSVCGYCNDFSHIRLILLGSRGHAGADKPLGRSA